MIRKRLLTSLAGAVVLLGVAGTPEVASAGGTDYKNFHKKRPIVKVIKKPVEKKIFVKKHITKKFVFAKKKGNDSLGNDSLVKQLLDLNITNTNNITTNITNTNTNINTNTNTLINNINLSPS